MAEQKAKVASSFQALLQLLKEHPHDWVPYEDLHPTQTQILGHIDSVDTLWKTCCPADGLQPLPSTRTLGLSSDPARSAQVKLEQSKRGLDGSVFRHTWIALTARNPDTSLTVYLSQLTQQAAASRATAIIGCASP